jgi:glycosyltransferase involved in cell wall biosynthesis
MISVVVTCFNQRDFIDEFFNTLHALSDVKFVFIDDGSSDGSERRIEQHIEQLEIDAVFLTNRENTGTVTSLRKALKKVDTEFVKFIAIDDPIDINEILRVSNSEMVNVDLLLSPVKIIGHGPRKKGLAARSKYLSKFMLLPRCLKSCALMSSNNIQLQGSIFRTDKLNQIINQISGVRLIEDWPMLEIFFSDPKNRVKFYPNSFSSYRVHENQITNSGVHLDALNSDLKRIRQISDELASKGQNRLLVGLKRRVGSVINWLILGISS